MPRVGVDAILLLSFGGPDGPDEVMPFLERVVAGRGVPRERLFEVAPHYHHFGGVSPIHARTEELRAALEAALAADGTPRPVLVGNRFSRPWIAETLSALRDAGHRRVLAIPTSAYSSYSGCRAYREALATALEELGDGAPAVEMGRPFWDAPGWIEANAARLREALAALGDPDEVEVLFSAHSIPLAMARGCSYEAQLREVATRVAAEVGVSRGQLVYQSRSGPPAVPWLEPDVGDTLRALAPGTAVIVAPIGFVVDHMEVVWDLDHEARAIAEAGALRFGRAPTAGAHPRFVAALVDRVARTDAGGLVACAPDCCPSGRPRP